MLTGQLSTRAEDEEEDPGLDVRPVPLTLARNKIRSTDAQMEVARPVPRVTDRVQLCIRTYLKRTDREGTYDL